MELADPFARNFWWLAIICGIGLGHRFWGHASEIEARTLALSIEDTMQESGFRNNGRR